MNKLDTSGFKDKDSKNPEYLKLYEEHDFITAYAKHTDLRIAKDGPELAIGAKPDGQQDWGIHGQAQLDFLIAQGLKPDSYLLDIGCGTGRLASKAIPYLTPKGEYVGSDISESAIKYAELHWNGPQRRATFVHKPKGDIRVGDSIYFHMIWAHSVFTHLPPEKILSIFDTLGNYFEHDFGQFFFTYKEAKANRRSGLKQYQYSPKWLIEAAAKHGLKAEKFPHDWPAGQKTMRVTKA